MTKVHTTRVVDETPTDFTWLVTKKDGDVKVEIGTEIGDSLDEVGADPQVWLASQLLRVANALLGDGLVVGTRVDLGD